MGVIYRLCVISLLLKAISATVLQGPVSRTANVGEWAEFSCSVACSHSIDWYVEGYSGDISDVCSTTLDGMMVCKEVRQTCSSASSTAGYIEILRVLAKTELASTSIAVQCAAVSLSGPAINNCPPFLSYSRYALLNVRSLATEQLATSTTESIPDPTPVVCPTPADSDETVTIIQQHTITHTITQTAVVTMTPDPDPAYSRGTSPGNHLSRILAGFVSWAMTLLAGFVLL